MNNFFASIKKDYRNKNFLFPFAEMWLASIEIYKVVTTKYTPVT